MALADEARELEAQQAARRASEASLGAGERARMHALLDGLCAEFAVEARRRRLPLEGKTLLKKGQWRISLPQWDTDSFTSPSIVVRPDGTWAWDPPSGPDWVYAARHARPDKDYERTFAFKLVHG